VSSLAAVLVNGQRRETIGRNSNCRVAQDHSRTAASLVQFGG